MNSWKKKLGKSLSDNKVVILFAILCILAIAVADKPLTFVAGELFTRIGRNSFIVLALIIPVLAGLGLNFGITIGAMAAQIAIFCVVYWGFTGIGGFLLALLIATPLAALFGMLIGIVFNKMKGAEMIGGMVLGYFADGLYQVLFLFIIGGVIPVNNPELIIAGGVGVKNTIDLKDNLKYALDNISLLTMVEIAFYAVVAVTVLSLLIRLITKKQVNWKKSLGVLGGALITYALTFIPFIEAFLNQNGILLLSAVELAVAGTVLYQLGRIVWMKFIKKSEKFNWKRSVAAIIAAGILYALTFIPAIEEVLLYVTLPAMTYLCIIGLCIFNSVLMKTRLGQNMRTVGQNRTVANSAGINVNRTRIIAMVLSTVLASWGQLISLQNLGTFSTYGAHSQVGQFAIAALLVGGASVQKATNKQAIVGVILFHTLFIIAPQAGQALFSSAMLGEYFRVFVAYGVIAVSLAMHAWKTIAKPKLQVAGKSPAPGEAAKAMEE